MLRCTPTPGLENTGSALPLLQKRGGAGRGGPASCGRGGARARRGRLELPLRGSAPTAVASPLRDRPALCRVTRGLGALPVELLLGSSAPHGDNHAHQATIPPRSGNHVFSAAATPSPGHFKGLPDAALTELSPLGTAPPRKKPRPLITATPSGGYSAGSANSGKGGSCVALKAEAASAWLLLFGGSHAGLRRQFRPRPHSWAGGACQATPTANPPLTPPLPPLLYLSFIIRST